MAVAPKFKEYNQKLEALTSINVSEAIDKAVQDKVLTEMKKQLPTYVPNAIAKYVKPRLNNSVHELYDTLYASVILDQEALDAQDAEPSFNKRTHDDQDPPNNREGEIRKKRTKDVECPNAGWFKKKSGSTDAANKRTTWFDLLLKSDIDQNEDHIIGPSTVAITNKLKELIKKDELTIADLEGARLEKLNKQYKNDVELEYHVDQLKAVMLTEAWWNNGEGDVSKPGSFERHMSKSTKPHPNNDFYYLVNLSTREKYVTSLTKHFATRSPNKVYLDKRIISIIRVDVKRKWGYGFLTSIILDEVNKFYDGTLLKIRDNLLEMVNKNDLGRGNKRVK
ncbi:hypothetical protein Tco_1333938, partial [Tanacetum coccineum]